MSVKSDAYLRTALKESELLFFHAMNLRGFDLYLRERAVLARSVLRELDEEHTRFWSDPSDEEKGILGRVFGNLYDFGSVFGRGEGATPNAYGVVTLVFHGDVFDDLSDIVITQKSVPKLEGDLHAHAIRSRDDVDALLVPNRRGSGRRLGNDFCEVSVAEDRVPLDHLVEVIVEPIRVGDVDVVEYVRERLSHADIDVRVTPREYDNSENFGRMQSIVDSLCEAGPKPRDPAKKVVIVSGEPEWLAKLKPERRGRFDFWLTYVYDGTVRYLRDVGDRPDFNGFEWGERD